ncbi:hypothetical protein C8R46DRAFT_120235 [Mycena filopes]|nr:hypothetical protein C8R46DRAFT_120235 [Mycena filopes]
MEVLQNRLNSFLKQKRGKSLKWPHPKTWKATPATLAEAGFYFDPSTDDPDNVTCFMCDKQVTEWAEEDDPFDIHWQKCASVCAWANLRCGLRRDADSHGRFVFPDKSRLPTAKAMEKARLETFTAHGWKHDKNKKHMATSKKMAHAGFVFTPAEAGDDTGACLYCHVALGNWDEDDDPMQHHRNRDKPSDPCPFLALAFGSALPPPKQPKTTKRSTKSKPLTHTDVVLPTKTYDGSDDDAPVPFPTNVAKTPRKAASTSTAKTPRTMTRSLSRANLRDPEPLSEEEDATPPPKKRGRSKSVSRPKAVEDDDRAVSPVPARQRRPTTTSRSRSKSVARPPSPLNPLNLFDDDVDQPKAEPQVPRKTSRSKSKARSEQSDDGHKAEERAARKPSRSKSKVREVEPDPDGEEEPVSRKPSRSKAKPKAADVEEARPPSRSQSSKPQPAPADASSDDGWFVAPLPPPPPAARSRTKSVSRAKAKPQEQEADELAPISRKEQKKKQEEAVDEPEARRPRSRTQSNAVEAAADPVVRKASRTKSKASIDQDAEVKKPASRAKAKAPPAEDVPEEGDEMEQYLPPPSSQRPATAKSRSKPPSKIEGIAEEPKAPRTRKPSSRATSKPVLPKLEPAVPTEEAVEEEVERAEPAARPPSRTRKASTRSTSTAPASRTTVKAKAKTQRQPSADMVDLDMRAPPTMDEDEEPAPAVAPRQVSKSKPASSAAGPSSQAMDVSISKKPGSKGRAPSPPAHKPRSTSHAQHRVSKLKEMEHYDEEDVGGGDGLPVVDISSDDEAKEAEPAAKAKGKGKMRQKEPEPENEVPVALAEKRTSFAQGHPRKVEDGDDDVEMAEVEESMLEPEPDPLPVTPPRGAPSAIAVDEPTQYGQTTSSEGFAFIPPLATDPFVNIDSLSEAEQEMTVEEWIRYQMGIEYERFKRDGERQLGMFKVRAEEVRRAIETL